MANSIKAQTRDVRSLIERSRVEAVAAARCLRDSFIYSVDVLPSANAKLFAHNLATFEFDYKYEEHSDTQMQYLLIHCFSPPSPHNLSFDVRALFIHCQSWFFDLFFICFKLNLQVFGARMFIPVIKYAYSVLLPFCLFIFEDNLKKRRTETKSFSAMQHHREVVLHGAMCIQLWCQREWQLVLGKQYFSIVIFWFSICAHYMPCTPSSVDSIAVSFFLAQF